MQKIIISILYKDTDFNDINTLYGYPPKIIWIHNGNMTTHAIIELLQKKAEIIHAFLDNQETGLLELEWLVYFGPSKNPGAPHG